MPSVDTQSGRLKAHSRPVSTRQDAGRSRVSELVFGGVTRTVLGQYGLPILLAH